MGGDSGGPNTAVEPVNDSEILQTSDGLDVWTVKADQPQITIRSIVAGLAIGSIVLFSNFQFGLQTGWVSMMGLPSSLLAFAVFKSLKNHLSYPYTDVENVFAQSLAVAVGTGPLAFGLVGVIPALEKFLTPAEAGLPDGTDPSWHMQLSLYQLIVFCTGLAFFGVFFAVLLRYQIIIKEKLRFPSGSATATLISVLHKTSLKEVEFAGTQQPEIFDPHFPIEEDNGDDNTVLSDSHSEETYSRNVNLLLIAFSGSAAYTLFAYFVPAIRNLPIFGGTLASSYLWTFQPSPAYIGQGIIMGLPTVSSMLFGAFLGWAVLAPLANHLKWVSGPIDDWKTGGQGWILWISLAIMIADTVTSFGVFAFKSLKRSADDTIYGKYRSVEQEHGDGEVEYPENDEVGPNHLVPQWVAFLGLGISMLFCVASVRVVFGNIVPVYSMVLAIILAVLLSILGVRALGETDLNPVSGIGKISQLVFALVVPKSHPGSVLINLIAGAITEAGAQQAGDLMQDLKTGHLVGASPRAQFIAQIIGSLWSIFLSSAVYRLYNSVYEIPGSLFRIPTALVWIDCSRLVNGQGLPPHAGEFAIGFAIFFGALSLINAVFTGPKMSKITRWFPSGVAVGIGIYNSPSFTLARFLGGCIAAWFLSRHKDHDSLVRLIILSSGLVLGEGVFSIVSLIMTSLNVPHF